MSRLGVKAYVADQLAGLSLPVECTVLRQRPKAIEVGEQAVIVVDVARSQERRYTIPRGAGRKQVDHQVRLDLYWLAADEQQGGDDFDTLLEQVDAIFRAVALPADALDPETSDTSQIVFIGEQIDTETDQPLLDESLQGLVAFSARKTLAVIEHIVG